MHVFSIIFELFYLDNNMRNKHRLSCGLVWMPAAGQRHLGLHVWADTADGAATRHARSDEDQEEELTYGKCYVVARLLARLAADDIGLPLQSSVVVVTTGIVFGPTRIMYFVC